MTERQTDRQTHTHTEREREREREKPKLRSITKIYSLAAWLDLKITTKRMTEMISFLMVDFVTGVVHKIHLTELT